MSVHHDSHEGILRSALEENGLRYTEQRSAVFEHLANTKSHPTADEVLLAVRPALPGISLATVYKSLETLVGCGLVNKLTYSDGSSRYDGCTDPHHHARCGRCGRVVDVPGSLPEDQVEGLRLGASDFVVTGYRLELTGYCQPCLTAERV
jgi:Fur family peroxide stress response transcriptional regulator